MKQNDKTRWDTDTRIRPNDFNKKNHIWEIAPRELGRDEAFGDFLLYLTEVYGYSLQTNISEFQELMRMRFICRNSVPLDDQIPRLIMCETWQKSETPSKIE